MFVTASTECFSSLPLTEAITRLDDLEYSNVEIALHENLDTQLPPSEVAANLEKAVALCADTHRLSVVAYSVQIQAAGDEFYRQFEACCKLAKATKVVTITVPSAEQGTPFNEEVEHLRRLVAIATLEGVRVSIKTQTGRLSQDVGTIRTLCDNVKGLGVTLDPSHFIYGRATPVDYDPILKYVYHVHLRDTTPDALQVRVGQGNVEYGRLVSQLNHVKYDRALSVDMSELPGIDPMAEMRKMRLLLESLL